jgi:hypothetical protein
MSWKLRQQAQIKNWEILRLRGAASLFYHLQSLEGVAICDKLLADRGAETATDRRARVYEELRK